MVAEADLQSFEVMDETNEVSSSYFSSNASSSSVLEFLPKFVSNFTHDCLKGSYLSQVAASSAAFTRDFLSSLSSFWARSSPNLRMSLICDYEIREFH